MVFVIFCNTTLLYALFGDNLGIEKQFALFGWDFFTSILVLLVFILLLSLLTIQYISKKKLSKAYVKITEDALFISEQNEEITTQFESIKRKNVELEKYRDHLERIDKNWSTKLNAVKEKALESERLKSNLLSNIYHEIRTPLNAIVGFVQILGVEEDIKNKKFIGIIEKNSDDLLMLVDNLIELSKLQAEEEYLSISKIRIMNFLNCIYNETISVRNVLKKQNLHIKLSIDDIAKSDILLSDKEKVYKIMKHLIDNALKYTDSGKITIGCKKQAGCFSFYVKDTGIGIKQDKLESIFNAFHKIEDHSNLYRGIGIGLALAKRLTLQINGNIKVESEYEKGTLFTLSVPDLESADKQNNVEKLAELV